MNITIDLTDIIRAILAMLATFVTCWLIPWIKARTTKTQQNILRATIKGLVFAAEQIYGAGEGKKKLQYVCDKLREQGFQVNLDEIEAAVGEYLNRGLTYTETIEGKTELDNYELPPLEEWPLIMIIDFCRLNNIPCDGCETKDEYIEAITQAGHQEPPDEAAEEPESTPEDDEGDGEEPEDDDE